MICMSAYRTWASLLQTNDYSFANTIIEELQYLRVLRVEAGKEIANSNLMRVFNYLRNP